MLEGLILSRILNWWKIMFWFWFFFQNQPKKMMNNLIWISKLIKTQKRAKIIRKQNKKTYYINHHLKKCTKIIKFKKTKKPSNIVRHTINIHHILLVLHEFLLFCTYYKNAKNGKEKYIALWQKPRTTIAHYICLGSKLFATRSVCNHIIND